MSLPDFHQHHAYLQTKATHGSAVDIEQLLIDLDIGEVPAHLKQTYNNIYSWAYHQTEKAALAAKVPEGCVKPLARAKGQRVAAAYEF